MKNFSLVVLGGTVCLSRSNAVREDTDSPSDTQTPKVFLHKRASSQSKLVYANTAMPLYQPSMICTRPLGRIDDVALKRWALLTVE